MAEMRIAKVRWYVCCEEERVVVPYRVAGIFYWRPCIRKTVLADGVWMDASEPAFPGYLFIGSVKGWRYIETCLIDVQLIRVNGVPHELEGKELALSRLFDEVQFNVTSRPVKVGQKVSVIESCPSEFSGLEGTVVKMVPVRGGEQVCVEFDLERMIIHGHVSLDHLEAIP
jgi:hypothetical protein